MTRRDLIRLLADHRCVLYRHGGNHDIFLNALNGRKAPVLRHNEIKDSLVKLILKQLDID